MLSTYWRGGRASALEILAGRKFNGLYLDGQESIFEEKPIESTGKAKYKDGSSASQEGSKDEPLD